jgi:replicative DNA helicase
MTNRTADDAAEVALLGAAVLVKACRAKLAAMDCTGLFARDAHQTLCDVVVGMHRDGQHVDSVTVLVRCCDLDVIDELGGPTAIHDVTCMDGCPTPAAWNHYLALVRDRSERRARIAVLRAELRSLEEASWS